MGKKITLNTEETAATVAEATLTDVFTTVLDQNVVLTGMHKYGQLALAAAAGAAVQNYRVRGSVQFWQPA